MLPLMSISRVTAVAALLFGLVGCGSRPEPTTQVVVPNSMAFMASPRFDDLDPHDWVDTHPVNYPVHGIDVARYQGEIDWHQARASGVAFAYIKATEGGDYVDPMFENHRKGARRAGVRQGAYHYYYFCRPAEEQARWFIENVPREWNSLPHVLDMEWNHRSPTCRLRPDGRTVRSEASKFLRILENHYGKRPIVYTTPDFYRDTDIGWLSGTQFWLRSVAGHPREVYPGQRWAFWQYTGTGVVPGISGPVDINVFAGSVDAWHSWAN